MNEFKNTLSVEVMLADFSVDVWHMAEELKYLSELAGASLLATSKGSIS